MQMDLQIKMILLIQCMSNIDLASAKAKLPLIHV